MSDDAVHESGTGTGDVERAPLNKVWVIKMGVIILVLLAFGAWGLYDATVVYPRRGAAYASYAEWQYLQKLNEAESERFGIFTSEASVPDPEQAYASLTDPETLTKLREDAANPSSGRPVRASARLARLEWLKALRTIGEMTPERTTIPNPRERLNNDLGPYWSQQSGQPKALASYDIPVQWMIMGGAWGIALLLIVLLLRTAAKRYAWDPSEKRLTLPGGKSFVPSDLDVFDMRRWDKYIVYIRLKPEHEIGGGEIKFDTYRHAKLEGWLLEMKEERFGPDEEGDDDPSEESEADVPGAREAAS
ncbi:MAG: hypothetical protein ACF8Q5_08330 [Phycisphaerales bacterium JB040]